MKNIRTFSHGNLKDVAHLAWPLIVGMMSWTVMDVTDTLFVGWLGKTELAAVGIGTTISFLLNGFFIGFFEGTKILVAQATGAGSHALANRAGWQSTMIAVPCGFAVAALGLSAHYIVVPFGAEPEVSLLAEQFLHVRLFGGIFWFAALAIGAYYQGIGDTKTPMRINILMCVLNVIFCVILIFGLGPIPKLGVVGSAYATVLSSAIALALIFWLFLKQSGRLPSLEFDLVKKLSAVGWPIGIRFFVGTAAWSLMTAFVSRLGKDSTAANQIACKFMQLGALPGYGVGEAAAILTGQFTGAGNDAGVRRAFWSSLKLSSIMMFSVAIIYWLFPRVLVSAFSTDPAVIAIGTELIVIVAVCQIFDSLWMTAAGGLNGTGDTRFTMIVPTVSTWLITVPLAYYLADVLELKAAGVWLAIAVEVIWLSVWMIWRFQSGAWKKFKIVD